MKKNILNLLISSTLLLSGISNQAIAAELGTALKADTMRVEPFADAKSAGSLTKNESVEILNKKGAWLQIKTAKSTGWVRLLSVKLASSGGNAIKGAVDVASGRAGTGKVVSTTGIRGLSADELKAAKFSESEMKKLESYEVSASAAKQFASSGGLSATSIPYLKGTK